MRREWTNEELGYGEMIECVSCGREYIYGDAIDLDMECEECGLRLTMISDSSVDTYYNNIDLVLEGKRY